MKDIWLRACLLIASAIIGSSLVIASNVIANANRYQPIPGNDAKILDTKTGDIYLCTGTSQAGQHFWERMSLANSRIIEK